VGCDKSVPSFINPALSPPGKFNKLCSMQLCIRPPPNRVTQDARGWLVTNDDWTGSSEIPLIGAEYLLWWHLNPSLGLWKRSSSSDVVANFNQVGSTSVLTRINVTIHLSSESRTRKPLNKDCYEAGRFWKAKCAGRLASRHSLVASCILFFPPPHITKNATTINQFS
jgi:hypothetical protein